MTSSGVLDTTSSIASELVAYGISLIDFPVESLAQPVVEDWLKFVEKDPGYRLRYRCLNSNNFDDIGGEIEGPDDGYVFRNGEKRLLDEQSHDIKEFFHYKKALVPILHATGVDIRQEANWLGKMRILHATCIERYLGITAELDKLFPEYALLERARRGVALGLPTLRLLRYKEATELGEEVAKMHTDRNWLTICLMESVPGLTYIDRSGVPIEYVKQSGKALVFPGKKAAKLLGPSVLPDVVHGVVAKPEALGKHRWSVVFFGHNDVYLTPEERKRLKF